MIKLKPIAEQVLLKEADEPPTWGEVKQMLDTITAEQNRQAGKGSVQDVAKNVGKTLATTGAKWALNLLTGGTASVIIDLAADYGEDVVGFLFNKSKSVSNNQLKNPKGSEFKEMTGPFWEAIKLSPEVSILLDDKIEKMCIDQVILPKLQNPGSESEELPNMDELLGKWLNDMGKLKDKADIHFKGASGDL